MTSFWHPFADMHAVASRGATTIVRGEGAWVVDDTGRRYLDATASLWYCNAGWGRTEIADAAASQMRELPAYSTFGDLTNRPAEALAERVAALAPVADSKVFLTSGGSDSIDTATKMARRYWQLRDEPDRGVLIRREKAYHGMHTAGTSLAGIPANATGHGELIDDVARGAVGRRRRAPSGDRRGRRGPGRGLLLRARDRRRRRVPPSGRIPRGSPRGVPRQPACCSSPTR